MTDLQAVLTSARQLETAGQSSAAWSQLRRAARRQLSPELVFAALETGRRAGEQTERTFAHMKLILDAAGATFANVVFLTIYLTDVSDQDVLNEISARLFGPDNPPPRTVLQVVALAHPDMSIEIDGVAAVPKT